MAKDQVYSNIIPLSPETASSESTLQSVDGYGRTMQLNLLVDILRELKIMNLHLSNVTGQEIKRHDVDLELGEQ
jgi:hypothetical protein